MRWFSTKWIFNVAGSPIHIKNQRWDPALVIQHSYIKQIKTEAHQIDFMDKLELKSSSVKQDVHDCVYI